MRVFGSGLSLGLADLLKQVFQLGRNPVEESKNRNLSRLLSRRNREFSRQSAEITGPYVSMITRNPLLYSSATGESSIAGLHSCDFSILRGR